MINARLRWRERKRSLGVWLWLGIWVKKLLTIIMWENCRVMVNNNIPDIIVLVRISCGKIIEVSFMLSRLT